MNIHHHRHRRIAHRQAADLGRGIEIALHDHRRNIQQVGDVIEAAARVVGRQQQRVIHLLRQIVERRADRGSRSCIRCASAGADWEGRRDSAWLRLRGRVPSRDRKRPSRMSPRPGRGIPTGGIVFARKLPDRPSPRPRHCSRDSDPLSAAGSITTPRFSTCCCDT